jgi:hypothetical protein
MTDEEDRLAQVLGRYFVPFLPYFQAPEVGLA